VNDDRSVKIKRRLPTGTLVVLAMVFGGIGLGLFAKKFRMPRFPRKDPTGQPSTSQSTGPADSSPAGGPNRPADQTE